MRGGAGAVAGSGNGGAAGVACDSKVTVAVGSFVAAAGTTVAATGEATAPVAAGDITVGSTVAVGTLVGAARFKLSGELVKPGGSSSASACAVGSED